MIPGQVDNHVIFRLGPSVTPELAINVTPPGHAVAFRRNLVLSIHKALIIDQYGQALLAIHVASTQGQERICKI